MNSNSNSKKPMPKPWEHKISLAVDRITSDIDDESVEVRGLIARCSCGDFEFPFPENSASDVISGHIEPHFDTHPLAPLSIAETGGHNIVLVMAVPGPTEDPVHMSVSVPKQIWEDGAALGQYLGMIGSPVHFRSEKQRRGFYDRANADGFHVVEMPLPKIGGIADIFSFLDTLRGGTHQETGEPGVAMFDAPEPEHMTGFLNQPDTLLDDIGEREDL